VPGRPTLYERAGKTHHYHFVCDRCERVYEIEGCGCEGPLTAWFPHPRSRSDDLRHLRLLLTAPERPPYTAAARGAPTSGPASLVAGRVNAAVHAALALDRRTTDLEVARDVVVVAARIFPADRARRGGLALGARVLVRLALGGLVRHGVTSDGMGEASVCRFRAASHQVGVDGSADQ
jgi:hypothetical protein